MKLKPLLTTTLFYFLFINLSHYCVKECPKGLRGHGFTTARSLQQHRRTCEHSNRVAKDRPLQPAGTSQLPSLKPKRLERTIFPKRAQALPNNQPTNNPSSSDLEHQRSEISENVLPQDIDSQMIEHELAQTSTESQAAPPSPSPPANITSSGRVSRLPRRFRDQLPRAQPAAVATPATPDEPPSVTIRRLTLIVRDQLRTAANPFGLIRHYLHRPSYDPDAVVPIDDLCNRRERFDIPERSEGGFDAESQEHPAPWPFANMSIWRLMSWANSGGRTKSESETTRLVNDVLLQEDFNPADLMGFNAHAESLRLDRAQNSSGLPKFQEATVTIEVPSGDKEILPENFPVPGLQYRSIISVIKSIFADPLAKKFHFTPFKLFRALPGGDSLERLYSEMYNSDAFIEEHDRVQRLPSPPDQPNCKLEKVVLGLMFWSDSTQGAFATPENFSWIPSGKF
ncbi:hypothetical protein FB446DRAFT_6084 [Lentinula raphanica]|nr:hypothetical protein FB446DRAFT_6084 [Lentinula raphanica]